MKLTFILVIFFSLGFCLQAERKSLSLSGRFVAFDKLQGLTNPREPRQHFVFEAEDEGQRASDQLVRLIYFAESTSIRGGAKFLGDEKLAYSKKWNLKIHQPTTINERSACKDVDDFLRAADGSIDENAAHEPLLRYRSTQTRADVKFDRLSAMPCFVLDSLEQ